MILRQMTIDMEHPNVIKKREITAAAKRLHRHLNDPCVVLVTSSVEPPQIKVILSKNNIAIPASWEGYNVVLVEVDETRLPAGR